MGWTAGVLFPAGTTHYSLTHSAQKCSWGTSSLVYNGELAVFPLSRGCRCPNVSENAGTSTSRNPKGLHRHELDFSNRWPSECVNHSSCWFISVFRHYVIYSWLHCIPSHVIRCDLSVTHSVVEVLVDSWTSSFLSLYVTVYYTSLLFRRQSSSFLKRVRWLYEILMQFAHAYPIPSTGLLDLEGFNM
jgi:hypothetical protein